MTEDWAIIGYRTGRLRHGRIITFAGGRSRRKLELMAVRMNASGDYWVSVRWVRIVRKP